MLEKLFAHPQQSLLLKAIWGTTIEQNRGAMAPYHHIYRLLCTLSPFKINIDRNRSKHLLLFVLHGCEALIIC